jgi:hypothetical protein
MLCKKDFKKSLMQKSFLALSFIFHTQHTQIFFFSFYEHIECRDLGTKYFPIFYQSFLTFQMFIKIYLKKLEGICSRVAKENFPVSLKL